MMSKFIIIMFSLLLVQYTYAQYIGSRIDALSSIPNIPNKYLELGNYGAMDFLSSPIIESLIQDIPTAFPVASIPEVACKNIVNIENIKKPCIVDTLHLDVPYTVNTLSAKREPYAINQPSFLAQYPFTNLRPMSIGFPISSNYLRSSPYEFNSLGFGSPYSFEVNVDLPYVGDVLIDTPKTVSPLRHEEPCVSNIPNYISTSVSMPVSTCAAQTIATEMFSAPTGLTEVLSRISGFTTTTSNKCVGGLGPANLAASRGGGLFVTSSSSSKPIGISVMSENIIQGSLSATGKLPFLGTVSLSDTLASFGYGTVNYNCGSGDVAMLSENLTDTPFSRKPRL